MILGAAGLALAAGLILRFGNLLGNSLWLDEAYTAFAAEHGLHFIWSVTPSYEVHPPLYYSLASLWVQMFGTTLAAYRALGVLAGVLTLPVLWCIGRVLAERTGDTSLRLPATLAAFGSVSPMLAQMAREVRPYPLIILVYALGLLLVLQLAQGRRGWRTALYLACLALLLWLHTLGALFAGSLALALLILTWRPEWRARDWARFAGLHILAGLLWAPAVAILIYQASAWVASTWLGFNFAQLPRALATTYGVPGWFTALFGVALIVVGTHSLRRDTRLAAALLVAAFLPALAAVFASVMISPVFIPRALSAVTIPALALAAVGAQALFSRASPLARSLPLVFALALAVSASALVTRQREQDWYVALARLKTAIKPGDVILAYPNESALPLRYAARDKGLAPIIRALPVEVPAPPESGPHPTGTRGVVSISKEAMRTIAHEPGVTAAPTVWLIQINGQMFDPADDFGRALSEGRAVRVDWKTIDTRVRGFARIRGRDGPAGEAAAR
jgi:uncharacterized membrane protein